MKPVHKTQGAFNKAFMQDWQLASAWRLSNRNNVGFSASFTTLVNTIFVDGSIPNLVWMFFWTGRPFSGEAPAVLAQCRCVIQGQQVIIQLTSVKSCQTCISSDCSVGPLSWMETSCFWKAKTRRIVFERIKLLVPSFVLWHWCDFAWIDVTWMQSWERTVWLKIIAKTETLRKFCFNFLSGRFLPFKLK